MSATAPPGPEGRGPSQAPPLDGAIRVRAFEDADAPALAALFERAIAEGAAGFYDTAQRAAWAGRRAEPPDWHARLAGQITLVAERGGERQGFMTLGHDGHLDLAFVLPAAMGTGIAGALHDRLLFEAGRRGMAELTTDASHLARRFLHRQGWEEIAAQEVAIGDVSLTNFRMVKRLVAPEGAVPGP